MERSSAQNESPGAGYLCFQSGADEGEHWAGLLVVTPNGLPQEFLYSGPLRATPVLAILYQERLEPQVRLSLVRSLLRGLRSRLTFLAVRPQDLDPAVLEEAKAPALVLEGETGSWLRAPAPPAEAVSRHLEDAVGLAEPMGRAVAALAYVVEYEGRSKPERDG